MSITVKNFVEEFENKNVKNTQINPTAVEDFIRDTLEVKDYISFAQKRELCKRVLDASCKKVGSIVEVDSVSRYLLFTILIIEEYTNLTFGNNADSSSMDEYDILCQVNLLNPILDTIGEEYTTCNNILNMMMGDIVANNNNTAAVLDSAAQRLLDGVDPLIAALAKKVEELKLDLNKLDIDKIMPLLNKMLKTK